MMYVLALAAIGTVGLIVILALVLHGAAPCERAELVRAVAELLSRGGRGSSPPK